MILERQMFSSVIDDVKNEICCSIPSGTKDNPITEISSDTFLDWEKLQYVYIPNNVLIVQKNAFNWQNIKAIFVNLDKTTIIDIPKHVKIVPIVGNEFSLFQMLQEVTEIKKQLEYDPTIIDEKNKKMNQLIQQDENDNNEKEEKLIEQQKLLEELFQKLEDYQNKTEEISADIINKIQKSIDDILQESITSKKSELSAIYSKIKEELIELNNVIQNCSDTKSMLETLKKKLNDDLTVKSQEIKKEFAAYIDDLSNTYMRQKNNILEQIIDESTKILINKNPCRNIVINIEATKKQFSTKAIFHKDFEKVLKLVSTKKPVLLKGPAGSGKNVIIEQVAKALGLQFYYCNDVTDEYKIMGFVDANGRYVQTQFFKAFTNGGIIFIDEIDNSNPSALLAVNASIGTGYNHYMAFPDGNFYQAHNDFHLIAAANTFGTGADMIYSGRQALDGATLNRFLPVVIDYDKDLERNIINHEEILDLYWQIRDIIQNNTIRHVISTRNIKNASDLLDMNCFDLGDIFDWTIIQGLDKNDLNIICSRIKNRDYYSTQFVNYASKKYNLDRKMNYDQGEQRWY